MKPKTNRSGITSKVSGYDVCQTPPHALEPLIPLLYRFQTVWESAAGPERLITNALVEARMVVINSDLADDPPVDFFTNDPEVWDVQVTNPPWSIKYQWIRRSLELGKPFALLVPYETTAAAVFQELAKKYHNKPYPIEALAPERRVNFKMPDKGWGKLEWDEKKGKEVMRGDSAQMPTIWLTWGLKAASYYEPYLTTYAIPMRKVKYNDDNTEKV
jgi:hypothetical protein